MTFRTLLLLAVAAIAPSALAQSPPKQIIEELAAKLEPTRTVVYKTVGGRDLHLHLFEPAGHKPSDARGCFVFIHGGGWTGGEPRRMYAYCDHFAKLGMLCASVEYRLMNKQSPITTPLDCVLDARTAIRYVKTHRYELGIDPTKIVVAGSSAGGHVAAFTAMSPLLDQFDQIQVSSKPAALVLFYPVIDTSPQGYGNEKCGADWKRISPVEHVREGLPPTLVFHGTGDTVTPFAGAKTFDERMRAAGNRCELVVHEAGVHGYFLYDRTLYDDAVRRTEEFLESIKILDRSN